MTEASIIFFVSNFTYYVYNSINILLLTIVIQSHSQIIHQRALLFTISSVFYWQMKIEPKNRAVLWIDGLQPCTQLWENVGETPAIEPICCTAATTRSLPSSSSLWEVEWRHTLSCFYFIVHTKESSLPPLCIFNNRFPPFYIYSWERRIAA